ncbi:MAG: His/Gly/Thr/Pro-type tRNA ligase C-terminal domain-containing protein [Candidatus Aenigmarchaeota archaeon]|nr:His/Gly/Thr/Pro-type tRNA ligase C-terminal domain-containing protein [Candidatus Aenigmarchaeota archaeon]MDW8149662.1 His/Gly/Thr/Pro-type tRNA ligase C-terminal domain-containing protein [Candidatus Aenigmarchaeota archaeon]
MEKNRIKPERVPEKNNLIEWYNSLLQIAEIVDRRYPVKGTFIWLPYGLKIMKKLVEILNKIFEENSIEEVYFPLFVPLEFAKINDEWFEGFKKEAFYLEEEKVMLRPTGEPAMYPIFKYWIAEGKLPIKIVQTVSSFRKEGKTTHTMIRDREITFWHEIHTVHKTREEAYEEVEKHKKIYEFIFKEVLHIPPIIVEKPKYEIFPGAESAYEFYTILPNGKLLENGSVNNLGQSYAKKFDLFFVDEKGNKNYVWQVCTGNGARFLVAAFCLHGDERGFLIPPKIAPIQVVIITIPKGEENFLDYAYDLNKKLIKENIRSFVDESEKTPGEKFNIWDIKGVPIRIEIGEKEVEENFYTIYRRDLKERFKVEKDKVIEIIKKFLEDEIPNYLYKRVEEFYKNVIKNCKDFKELNKLIESGNIAKANWCGELKCFEEISKIGLEAIGFLEEKEKGKCIVCGKETEKLTFIGKVY